MAGAEAGGKSPSCGDVEPARWANAQAAAPKLTSRCHCFLLWNQHGILEPDGAGVEELAHALDNAWYPAHNLRVAFSCKRGGRHRSCDDSVVPVIPQGMCHTHQCAASADAGDEAMQANPDMLNELGSG